MAVGQLVRVLLEEAAVVVVMGGPLVRPRPAPPLGDHTMVSVLTRGGVYIGSGDSGSMAADARGGPMIQAASELLKLLVQRSNQANPGGR